MLSVYNGMGSHYGQCWGHRVTQPELQQCSPGMRPRSWEAVAEDQLDHRSFRPQQHCEPPSFPAWAGPRLTSEQRLEKVLFLPDFWWEELMSFSALTLGKKEKVFYWAVTIIKRPDRLAVLVGIFIWIKSHVYRSVKWFCVCVACCIMISLIHLIAWGALSSVAKPWYLVLQAWYLIKTNLQVLSSTVFV